MKAISKIIVALVVLFCSAPQMFSQECLGLSRPGTAVQYACYLGDKKQKDVNILLEVQDAVTDGTKTTATVLMLVLNDKGKTAKAAKMMGLEEGLLLDTEFDNGAYTLVQDFIFAQTDDRMGFFMKVPAKMEVGQEIEGGTFSSSAKVPMMGRLHNKATLSNLKVTAEEDMILADGSTVHCYVVKGNVDGEVSSRYKQTGEIIFKFAPGLGLVYEEIPLYLDMKKSYRTEMVAFQMKDM